MFQVERALLLIKTGTVTIATIREAKIAKKAIKMPPIMNLETGKESTRHTAFSELSWGKATRSYLVSINKISDSAMKKIMDDAAAFAKDNGTESSGSIDVDDERAQLSEGSDLEDLVD
jgi:hypothetical protein